MTTASGITSLDRWLAARTPVKMGGLARGAHAPDNITKVLQFALGLPIQLVSGYKGLADIRLAAEGGELSGACWDWTSIKSTWRAKLDSGEVVPVLQLGSAPHPDLPRVPVAISLAKTDEAPQLIQVALRDLNRVARPYVAPPGTPKDRVQLLRRAFLQTLHDPDYLADAKVALESGPVPGDEVERIVHGLFRLDPGMAAKLRAALYQ